MKANEIRVGNLVMDGYDIETVNARMIEMLEKDQGDFDGIELSEEWILKLGGKKVAPEHWIIGDFTFMTVSVGEKIPRHILYRGVNILMSYDCKDQRFYVHQIQNLVHSLTGTELTINPTQSS